MLMKGLPGWFESGLRWDGLSGKDNADPRVNQDETAQLPGGRRTGEAKLEGPGPRRLARGAGPCGKGGWPERAPAHSLHPPHRPPYHVAAQGACQGGRHGPDRTHRHRIGYELHRQPSDSAAEC
jgi:hypothetical protein